ncbi:MAG: AMP-binding protein [Rhodospirillaceae bacterium]|nr:AMP-binding protein [Rhodospirillales bacterium]
MFLGLAHSGNAPALIDDCSAAWVSYRQLADAVMQTGERLESLADRPLVFLFAANSIEACVCYLSALACGGAIALFTDTLPPGRADALIALYRPHVVIGHAPAEGYGETPGLPIPAWRRTDPDSPKLHPDLAVLLSTSGSTGSPKLVRLSRKAVCANAMAIMAALRISEPDRSALNLPLSYSYGLSVLNSHLLAGASVVLTGHGITSKPFWQRLAEERVTSMPGVPSVYEVLRRLGFDKVIPDSLTTLTQAGGKLGDGLIGHFHDAMAARGGQMFVMYGATEATARMAVLPPELLPTKLGAAGQALPGGRFEISNGTLPGEVIYHGPNVMMGYAETAEDLAVGDVLGGTLLTGDLGRLDEDGVLWITGRAKRIAKVNGLRLNLDEIEAQTATMFSLTAAVEGANQLVLVMETDSAHSTEIRRRLAAAFALPANAVRLHCVPSLPLSANGKIDRAAIEALLACPTS